MVVDSYFTSAGTETCDANNKVKEVDDVATTGTHLVSAMGGTTRNMTRIDSGFDPNTVIKVRVLGRDRLNNYMDAL